MHEDTPAVGRIERLREGFRGHLARELAHPPAAVWAMLTASDKLPQWLASGSIEARVGGVVRIDFADSGTVIDSRLSDCADGRLLEYSWSHGNEPLRPLRWELAATAQGTRLALTVDTPPGEDAAKACAGFEGHLEMLAAALEGVPIKFPFDLYQAARAAYRRQLEA